MFVISRINLTRLLCFAIFCGAGHFSLAQDNARISLSASVDRNRIVLGEPFNLNLKLQFPEKTRLAKLPDLPDSLPHFDILEELKKDTSISNGIVTLIYSYRLTSFDSGHWTIPAFSIAAGKKEMKSDTLGMDVMMVPLEGNSYNDIRDIIDVESEPFDWKRWGAIGVTVLILILGLWYYLKNRNKPRPIPDVYDSKLSPFDQAIQTLKKVREENAVEKGDPKTFYIGVYNALRIYLLRQYKLPVMSATTGDVLLQLKGDYLGADELAQLAEVLRIADAVKFAKYPSSKDESFRSIEEMESIIRNLNKIKS